MPYPFTLPSPTGLTRKPSPSRAGKRKPTARPGRMFEMLESRVLLSTTVTGLTLVNADTERDISTLTNGAKIDLKSVGSKLNVRANVGTTVKSVKFTLDGSTYPVENVVPYAMTGGSATDYNSWVPTVGTHTLVTTAFSAAGATGTASSPVTVTFTVVNTTGATTPPVTPPTTPVTPTPPASPTGAPAAPPVIAGANAAPKVSITNPVNNSSSWGPSSLLINTAPTDADGSIQRVDFFSGGTYLSTTYDAPFTYAWLNVNPGTYSLTAVTYDNMGAKATSAAITVKVVTPAVNRTLVVSTGGNDNGSGSASSPFRTIGKAASVAIAGDVVLIKPGTYREGVVVANSGMNVKPITFKAETPGTVVVDGTQIVTSWTKDGGTTKPVYTTNWSYDFFNGTVTGGKRYGGLTGAPGHAEQTYFNGKLLTRVMTYAELTPGTFTINYDTDKMSIYLPGGVAPSSGTVTAATTAQLFKARSSIVKYVQVQDIIFRHAANHVQVGAVSAGDGWRLIDVLVERTNGLGVRLGGYDVRAIRVTSQDNGQTGIGGSGVVNGIMDGTISQRNNYKHFAATWESGGGKWSRVDGFYVHNHTARENIGFGLWFDIENKNVSIVGGYYYNQVSVPGNAQKAAGILFEVSPGPLRFDGVTVWNNPTSGIIIAESTHVSVRNSTFSGNGGSGVAVRDIANRAYATADVKVVNSRFDAWKSGAAISLTLSDSYSTAPGLSKMFTDGNTFDPAGTNGLLVGWGTAYSSISELQKKLGFEKNGKVATINFVAPV